MLNWRRLLSMLSVEELFSFGYMLVSSVCLLCQLRGQSFVTVECRNVWVFCLENTEQRGTSTRYVLDGDTVETRCNGQGTSGLFQLLLFLLISLELLIFCVVAYGRRPKSKSRNATVISKQLSFKLSTTLFIITAILTTLLLVLPLTQYHVLVTTTTTTTTDSTQRGFFDKIFHSPLRALLSFIISLITAPLRSILQKHFTLELDLAKTHPNFTCVEPVPDGGTTNRGYKCPAEFSWPAAAGPPAREPSACKETFYCVDDCEVAFPAVVISSLCVILASFALCYRLLRLRHSRSESETTLEGQCLHPASSVEVRRETPCLSTVADRHRDAATSTTMPLKASSFCAIKGKDARAGGVPARSIKTPTSDRERQSKTAPRSKCTKITNFEGHGSDGQNGANVEDLKGNGRVTGTANNCVTREVNGWRVSKKKTETRWSEKRLVSKTKTAGRSSCRRRGETEGRLEEVDKCCSSSSEPELGDVTFVEDESEYYMSGFRL